MALSDLERIAAQQKGPDEKKKFEDDGRSYIFPAGETAPGAAFAPASPDAPVMPSVQIPAASEAVAPSDKDFVNPSQTVEAARTPSATAPTGMSSSGMSNYDRGINQEIAATDKLGKAEGDAFAKAEGITKDYQNKLQEVQNKEQEAFTAFEKEDAETKRKIDNFELKPEGIFAGKSTWQKVVGGIGMFLGSITPEGAKNVQDFINSEIERDIDRQKQNFALLKDKRSENVNMYKRKLDRFGSEKLAMLSMKQDALSAVDFQIRKLQANAKGDLARGKLEQGRGIVQMDQEKIRATMATEWAKLNKETAKGQIPGYEGANQNPAIVKDLTERITAKNSAMNQINRLENLMKEGAENPFSSNNGLAEKTRTALAADLAKAMFGRSSDAELQIAMELVPDITKWMRKDSTSKKELQQLKAKLINDVDAAASAAGYSGRIPSGARKMN